MSVLTRGRSARPAIAFVWVAGAAALWILSPFRTLPSPPEVGRALVELWNQGLGPELVRTLGLIGEATAITAALTLPLAYASVSPIFRPLVAGLTKLRFLALTGLVVPFTLLTGGGVALKLALLTFGMATFYLTAMARIVMEIPETELDHLRVLGASDTRIVWDGVVRSTLDRALDALRQNVAMGWSMITMVEGISRADGGLGAMLLDQHRHFRLSHVFALLVVVLLVGLVIDGAMVLLAQVLCPHLRASSEEGAES
jgi:NitT/TauT family transport system permease protein